MIKYSKEAKQKLLEGVRTINKAVSTTYGPKGRNVAIQKFNGVHVTKDGVTVANAVFSDDPTEQMAIQMVRQAAARTAAEAGDGTTLSTILSSALVEEGMKAIESGSSPITIKRSLELAAQQATEYLNKIKVDVTDNEQIKAIAKISANNDEEIGSLIAQAIEQVGKNGIVTVEESDTPSTNIEVVEGAKFDKGFISHKFANQSTMKAELENPLIFIYGKKISRFSDIRPAMMMAVNERRPLLVICEGMDGEAYSNLVVNHVTGKLKSCVVHAPKYGIARKEILQDIAILTGGIFINEEEGHDITKISRDFLGEAEKVTVDINSTNIIEGKGDPHKIQQHGNTLKHQLSADISEYEKKKIKERISTLLGKAAILKVGAATDVEMREKKDRIDDALHATRAALAEGIIPGAGFTAWKIGYMLDGRKDVPKEYKYGSILLTKALIKPFLKIMENAGYELKEVVSDDYIVTESDLIFNSLNGQWVNPYEAGIVDPAKVLRLAIQNAVSVASMILTTECVIYDDSPKELQ